MENRLKGRRVAILATDGVEQDEIEAPRRALDAAGAIVHVIAPVGIPSRRWITTRKVRASPSTER